MPAERRAKAMLGARFCWIATWYMHTQAYAQTRQRDRETTGEDLPNHTAPGTREHPWSLGLVGSKFGALDRCGPG